MASGLIVFFASLAMVCGFVYILTGIWFRGKKSTYLKLFFLMGIMYSLWALFNGIGQIVDQNIFEALYVAIMTLICYIPAVMLAYVLYFTESRFAGKKWVGWLLAIATTVDAVILWTNPLHHGFIAGFNEHVPLSGMWFPGHAGIAYALLILTLIVLFRYIFKNIKKTPALGFIGLAFLIPIVFNILYTFNVLNVGFDLTPFAFVLMFAIFAGYSIQMRLFNIESNAIAELFNSLSEASIVVDSIGLVVSVNPAFRENFTGIEIVPYKTRFREVVDHIRSYSKGFSPSDIFERIVSNETQKIKTGEITFIAGENTRYYSVMKDTVIERGQYAGFIFSMADISNYRVMIDEMVRLKEVAESASNAKSLFLANMSHEMRTPMNAIIGMLQIAKTSSDPESISQSLEKIDSASKHLLGIINDILDMLKIEESILELNETSFEFINMIDTVVNINSVKAQEKGQDLSVIIDERIPKVVYADELRISQVLGNLLGNAIKFTPDGGSVALTARLLLMDELTAKIGITIEDTGIGISEEQKEKMFNSFEKADLSFARKYGGAGLGLPIARRIIEMMGGRLSVESVEDVGSNFHFDICVKYFASDMDGPKDETEAAFVYDFSGHTILLVEDVDINREIICSLMAPTGVNIRTAENGQIALSMYTKDPDEYDLIFMDIQMPGMDGYEATKKIREVDHEYSQKVPIIAMTANAFAEDIEKAKKASMVDHIAKPVALTELFEKTGKYIRWNKE